MPILKNDTAKNLRKKFQFAFNRKTLEENLNSVLQSKKNNTKG